MNKIDFPAAEEIIMVNKRLIRHSRSSEKHAVLNKGAIDFLVDRVSGMANIWDAASKILISLIEAHAFLEANKRTAFVVTKTFLRKNGFNFSVDKSDIVFIYRIAGMDKKPGFGEVRDWIKKHCDEI